MSEEILQVLNFVERYGITTMPAFTELQGICSREGLNIEFFSFSGRIKAIYQHTADHIELLGLQKGLQETDLKHILACVLAHRISGRQYHTDYARVLGLSEYYFDVKSECLATLLLVPPRALAGSPGEITAGEISDLAGIPEWLAEKRLDIFRQHSV